MNLHTYIRPIVTGWHGMPTKETAIQQILCNRDVITYCCLIKAFSGMLVGGSWRRAFKQPPATLWCWCVGIATGDLSDRCRRAVYQQHLLCETSIRQNLYFAWR